MDTHLALITLSGIFGEEGDSDPYHTPLSPVRHRQGRRSWPRHATRHARRPWLRCRHCGRRLVQTDVFDGAIRLPVGRAYSDGDVPLYCPSCGTPRVFKQRIL